MLQTIKFTRRKFLKSGSGALMGTLAGSSVLATLAPSRAWSMSLETFDSPTGEALLMAVRHIFPHASLDDAVYALVVKDLDAAAAGDKDVRSLLESGVKQLNADAGGNWLEANDREQLTALVKQSGGDFFGKLQGTAVVSLYNNELAWAHFGYEGASFDEGGYINRGFQDIDWLPNPPAEASPPKA